MAPALCSKGSDCSRGWRSSCKADCVALVEQFEIKKCNKPDEVRPCSQVNWTSFTLKRWKRWPTGTLINRSTDRTCNKNILYWQTSANFCVAGLSVAILKTLNANDARVANAQTVVDVFAYG
jgi:hypothetical protein